VAQLFRLNLVELDSGFRRNFSFNAQWQGKVYAMKKVEAIAAPEGEDWIIITVIVKFF
jgi:hypothetical protein